MTQNSNSNPIQTPVLRRSVVSNPLQSPVSESVSESLSNSNLNQREVQISNWYHLVTISSPVLSNTKYGFKSAIASTVTVDHLVFTQMFYIRMYYLGLRNINLVIISDLYPRYVHKEIKEKYHGEDCTLSYDLIHPDDFFSLDTLDYFFNKKKGKSFEFVFAFQNQSWHDICARFTVSGIDISGGSNNKKHLLSPLQHRLSLFLMCLYEAKSFNVVNESFHSKRPIDDNKLADYSTKSAHKQIIDFARSNEIYKNILLGESPIKSELGDILNKNNKNSTPSNKESNSNKNTNNKTNQITSKEKRGYHTSAISHNINKSNTNTNNLSINPKPVHNDYYSDSDTPFAFAYFFYFFFILSQNKSKDKSKGEWRT